MDINLPPCIAVFPIAGSSHMTIVSARHGTVSGNALGIGPLRSLLWPVHRSRGCCRKRYRDVRKTIVICDEPAMGNTAIQGGRYMSITEIGAKFKVSRSVKRPQFNRVTPSRDRGFLVGCRRRVCRRGREREREGEGKRRRRIGSYPFNPVQAHEI